jgi:hypothetical protein
VAERRASAALGVAVAVCALLAAAPAALAAPPIWELAQPAPPAGAPFKVPLGPPGDLKFIAENRGLLSVTGNATVSPGIYAYNGQSWHELATVCGDSPTTSRIAIAGPDEFWTISAPSAPRQGAGLSLCHFLNGQVVASYGTAIQSPDPYREMDAAACNGPDDCWFAGIGSQDPTGTRIGSFHLHWNGSTLTTSYYPQGRGVSALLALNGQFIESTFDGAGAGDTSDPVNLAQPESPPNLLHRIVGGQISQDPFTITANAGLPPDPYDLLALGTNGTDTWAVGGGAASGPSAPPGGTVAAGPVALEMQGSGSWQQPSITDTNPLDPTIDPSDRFVGVAPIPGSTSAWMALQPYADRSNSTTHAEAALVAPDGTTSITRLPTSGAGRGSAALIAFTAPNDGWLVTSAGWIFHYTDGSSPPLDTDANFGGPITFRPNEAAAQFIPDAQPDDDSQLFAPPIDITPITVPPQKTVVLKPLLKDLRSHLSKSLLLTITFVLVRKAKVGLVATRHGHVVGQTRFRLLKPGHRALRLRLSRAHYPDHLKFRIFEPGVSSGSSSNGAGTVTT